MNDIIYNILTYADFQTLKILGECYGYTFILSRMKLNSYWYDRFRLHYNYKFKYDKKINWKLSYFNVAKESLNKIKYECIYNCIQSNNDKFLELLIDKSIIKKEYDLLPTLWYFIYYHKFELCKILITKFSCDIFLYRQIPKSFIDFTALIDIKRSKYFSNIRSKEYYINSINIMFICDDIELFNWVYKQFDNKIIQMLTELWKIDYYNMIISPICVFNSYKILQLLIDNNILLFNNLDDYISLAAINSSIDVVKLLCAYKTDKYLTNDNIQHALASRNYEMVEYLFDHFQFDHLFLFELYPVVFSVKCSKDDKKIFNYLNKIVLNFNI